MLLLWFRVSEDKNMRLLCPLCLRDRQYNAFVALCYTFGAPARGTLQSADIYLPNENTLPHYIGKYNY